MAWYLYGITDGSALKIGHARDVDLRLAILQTGNPRELSVAYSRHFKSRRGAEAAERKAHKMFRASRIRSEWFDVDILASLRVYAFENPSFTTKDGLPYSPEDNERRVRMLLSHPVLSEKYPTDDIRAAKLGLHVGFVSVVRELWEMEGRPFPKGCEAWASS